MDAISFVLGVKTGVLRGNNLRELIRRDISSEYSKITAFVELVYQLNDNEELILKRTILPKGNSEYRINNKVVKEEEYEKKIKDLGIVIKARNFLVFQVIIIIFFFF